MPSGPTILLLFVSKAVGAVSKQLEFISAMLLLNLLNLNFLTLSCINSVSWL